MNNSKMGVVEAPDGLRRQTGTAEAVNEGSNKGEPDGVCEQTENAKRRRCSNGGRDLSAGLPTGVEGANTGGEVVWKNEKKGGSEQGWNKWGWSCHEELLSAVDRLSKGIQSFTKKGFVLVGEQARERILLQIPFACVVAALGEPLRTARAEASSSFEGAWLTLSQGLAWRCATVVLTVRQRDSRQARAGGRGVVKGGWAGGASPGEWEGLGGRR